MKLLVSCDEYCFEYDGKYYLSSNGMIFAKRYLMVFDDIRYFIRTRKAKNKEEIRNRFELSDSRIEIFPAPFFQGPKQYARTYFQVRKAAKKAVKECAAAIFRLPSTTGFAALKAWYATGLPYETEIVFDCFDGAENAPNIIEKTLWKHLHKMQVKACKSAEGVACVTKSHLQKRYFPLKPDALATNYSSIELLPDFYYKSRSYPDSDIFKIIHVANQVQFGGKKGQKELIEAAAEAISKGHRIEVIFVGADYLEGVSKLQKYAFEKGIGSHVKFGGYLNRIQLREELKNANIAVLPTKAEGLPRVIIEAMAMGLPCITSPVSGNPELIDKEFLVDYADTERLAQKIIELKENHETYEFQSNINFLRSKEYSNEILNPRRKTFFEHLRNKGAMK